MLLKAQGLEFRQSSAELKKAMVNTGRQCAQPGQHCARKPAARGASHHFLCFSGIRQCAQPGQHCARKPAARGASHHFLCWYQSVVSSPGVMALQLVCPFSPSLLYWPLLSEWEPFFAAGFHICGRSLFLALLHRIGWDFWYIFCVGLLIPPDGTGVPAKCPYSVKPKCINILIPNSSLCAPLKALFAQVSASLSAWLDIIISF